MQDVIVSTIRQLYPNFQAIYLFGSEARGDAWPESDVAVAVLLPLGELRMAGDLALSECRLMLEKALGRDVDLLNARLVSTVMQMQIIYGERLATADLDGVAEFEMLVISYFQKLNGERGEIIAEFERTGRAYQV